MTDTTASVGRRGFLKGAAAMGAGAALASPFAALAARTAGAEPGSTLGGDGGYGPLFLPVTSPPGWSCSFCPGGSST